MTTTSTDRRVPQRKLSRLYSSATERVVDVFSALEQEHAADHPLLAAVAARSRDDLIRAFDIVFDLAHGPLAERALESARVLSRMADDVEDKLLLLETTPPIGESTQVAIDELHLLVKGLRRASAIFRSRTLPIVMAAEDVQAILELLMPLDMPSCIAVRESISRADLVKMEYKLAVKDADVERQILYSEMPCILPPLSGTIKEG